MTSEMSKCVCFKCYHRLLHLCLLCSYIDTLFDIHLFDQN